MIEKIIDFSARNRFIIIVAYLLIVGAGIWAVVHTPLDAIPDLSENQVIVFTAWMGRSPKVVEDQITFPLVTALQGVPEVHAIRAQSMFGMSFIYIIFEERTDLYWARSRVLEKLATIQSALPSGAKVQLGPDGTGVGHVFWYTVEGKYDLGTLRAIQDWYIKLHLQGVPGVAEVASVGGFVRQYQIDVDPNKMKGYGVTLADVRTLFEAVGIFSRCTTSKTSLSATAPTARRSLSRTSVRCRWGEIFAAALWRRRARGRLSGASLLCAMMRMRKM